MTSRPHPSETSAQLLSQAFARIKSLEDAAKRRMLPAGYEFQLVAGQIAIVRTSDGDTAVTGP